MLSTIRALNKKSKENFADNNGHNIFRIFDVSPNFFFTKSEKKVWLLVLNMVDTSYLSSCQMIYGIGSWETKKYLKNLKTWYNFSLVLSLLLKMKSFSIKLLTNKTWTILIVPTSHLAQLFSPTLRNNPTNIQKSLILQTKIVSYNYQKAEEFL